MLKLIRCVLTVAALGAPAACAKEGPAKADTSRPVQKAAVPVPAESSITARAPAAPLDTMAVPVESAASDTTGIAAALRTVVDSMVASVDTSLSLAQWTAAHPGEAVDYRDLMGKMGDRVCRTSAVRTAVGELHADRHAVFYIPDLEAPRSLDLPTDTSRLADRLCKLGSVALQLSTTDDALSRALIAAGRDLSSRNHAALRLVVSGREQGSTAPMLMMLVYSPPGSPGYGQEARDSIAHAQLYSGGLYHPPPVRPVTFARIDSALEWSAFPRVASDIEPIVGYLHETSVSPPRKPLLDSALLRAVRATSDSAPRFAPARRAAAYLAVDLVLNAYAGEHAGEDPDGGKRPPASEYAIENAVEFAGLTYESEPMNGSMHYARDWLFKAFESDSSGPAGRSAYMQLLADGWRTAPGCPMSRMTERDMVIAHGESGLRFGNTDPLIHYYLGLAYADRYSEARRQPVAGDVTWQEARRRGIEQLTKAVDEVHDPAVRTDAWRRTMRLLFGVPHERFFDCVYPDD